MVHIGVRSILRLLPGHDEDSVLKLEDTFPNIPVFSHLAAASDYRTVHIILVHDRDTCATRETLAVVIPGDKGTHQARV